MGHLKNTKDIYRNLFRKYSLSLASLPNINASYDFLKKVFNEEEAKIAAKLPIRFSPLEKIIQEIRMNSNELEKKLDNMAQRGLVMDIEKKRKKYYMLMPLVPGLIEILFMKNRNDINQKEIANLIEKMTNGTGLIPHHMFKVQTALSRILVEETSLDQDDIAEILSYEKLIEIVKEAKRISVTMCYCRHEKDHLGFNCKFPRNVCIQLNTSADFLIRKNLGRKIDRQEAIDILSMTSEMGLVHVGDNVQKRLAFICNCCKCCCALLNAYNNYGLQGAVKTSNFLAHVLENNCDGCGVCARHCPANAISIKPTKIPEELIGYVDENICLGCGLCVKFCNKNGIHLKKRKTKVMTPKNNLERIISVALESGKIQDILFNDPENITHLAARQILGVILNFPLIKRTILNKLIRSKFVSSFLQHVAN